MRLDLGCSNGAALFNLFSFVWNLASVLGCSHTTIQPVMNSCAWLVSTTPRTHENTVNLLKFSWWSVKMFVISSVISKPPHFGVWGPRDGAYDPQIRTWRDFCIMHSTAKFHNPMFNCSIVVLLTDTQRNRRCWKHPPHSGMLRRWVKK